MTPQPLDSEDAAADTSSGEAHSGEPTYTANAIMLQFMTNQRATFSWYAVPGREIVLPVTASNGVGLQVITVGGSAVNTGSCWHYTE